MELELSKEKFFELRIFEPEKCFENIIFQSILVDDGFQKTDNFNEFFKRYEKYFYNKFASNNDAWNIYDLLIKMKETKNFGLEHFLVNYDLYPEFLRIYLRKLFTCDDIGPLQSHKHSNMQQPEQREHQYDMRQSGNPAQQNTS